MGYQLGNTKITEACCQTELDQLYKFKESCEKALVPAQIFLSHPVVLESICYRTRAKRLINESNTTGGLRKIWTGCAGAEQVVSVMPTKKLMSLNICNCMYVCIV